MPPLVPLYISRPFWRTVRPQPEKPHPVPAGNVVRPTTPHAPGVLVVDAVGYVRRTLERALVAQGARVWTAADAGEALLLLWQEQVQVMVAGLEVPAMGTARLLERVRDYYPGVRRVQLLEKPRRAFATPARSDDAAQQTLFVPWSMGSLAELLTDGARTAAAAKGQGAATGSRPTV